MTPSSGTIFSPGPVKRTLIVKTELEGVEGKELNAWVTEFAPKVSSGKHYHPWNEFVYVLQDGFTIEVQGKLAVTLRPGQIINLARKQVHEGKNLLDSPTKVLVFVDEAVISDRSEVLRTSHGVTGISES